METAAQVGQGASESVRGRVRAELPEPGALDALLERLVHDQRRRLAVQLDVHDVRDVIQDVALDYVQAIRARADAGGLGSARGTRWLARRARARLRRWARRRADTLARVEDVGLDQLPCEAADLDLHHHVRARLAALSPRLRAVLVLRFLHGVPYSELASRLDLPPATLKARVYRALPTARLLFDAGSSAETGGPHHRPGPSARTAQPPASTPTHSAQARSSAAASTASSVTYTR